MLLGRVGFASDTHRNTSDRSGTPPGQPRNGSARGRPRTTIWHCCPCRDAGCITSGPPNTRQSAQLPATGHTRAASVPTLASACYARPSTAHHGKPAHGGPPTSTPVQYGEAVAPVRGHTSAERDLGGAPLHLTQCGVLGAAKKPPRRYPAMHVVRRQTLGLTHQLVRTAMSDELFSGFIETGWDQAPWDKVVSGIRCK